MTPRTCATLWPPSLTTYVLLALFLIPWFVTPFLHWPPTSQSRRSTSVIRRPPPSGILYRNLSRPLHSRLHLHLPLMYLHHPRNRLRMTILSRKNSDLPHHQSHESALVTTQHIILDPVQRSLAHITFCIFLCAQRHLSIINVVYPSTLLWRHSCQPALSTPANPGRHICRHVCRHLNSI